MIEKRVVTLDHVTLRSIDKYREKQRSSLSDKSMHNEATCLKRFLAWCVQRQLIAVSPLAEQVFKKPRRAPRGGPTLEQINAILESSTTARKPIVAVAAFAGMRIGEIVRLRVEDVDFEGNWLHVVSREGLETKSGHSWKLPIHPRLRKLLKGVSCSKTGWFFTAEPSPRFPTGGHHINPRDANASFIKILEKLKISAGRASGFTFHSLRSSFKTIAINSGVPREVVDAWQDHQPDRAVSNQYYKLSDETSQEKMLLVQFGQ